MKNTLKYLATSLVLFICACQHQNPSILVRIDADSVVNSGYIGNGVQWDPYALNYGDGQVEISDTDWQKLYARLDYMQPAFIRMMINTGSLVDRKGVAVQRKFEHLAPLLDYCQSRDVTVLFGDWGGSLVDKQTATIDYDMLDATVDYLEFLICRKGYTCIRYFNLVNEPNGDWSSTNGNFDLWAQAIRHFYDQLKKQNLHDRVLLVGPDAAIWTTEETAWVTRCRTELEQQIGLYDIHTYPSKCTVNSGQYTDILKAYRHEVPVGKKMVMGEIGFKFVEAADSLYQQENERRIGQSSHASPSDSQMFVFDTMYGIDMADALFQTIAAGFSGSIAWMLDDAMHYKESPNKLKIWGFWNIFGDEIFGADQEVIRPWYYAWSLLCRFLPQGSDFNPIVIEGAAGIRGVSATKGANRTIAMVNVTNESQHIRIRSSAMQCLSDSRVFRYGEKLYRLGGKNQILPEIENATYNFAQGEEFELPAQSLLLITNYDY
ncbi:MAG: hypothetical protein RR410_01595 [Alistipes sp.]